MSVALLLGFIFAQIQGGAVQLGGKDDKNTYKKHTKTALAVK